MKLVKPQAFQAVIEKKEQVTNTVFLVTFRLVAPAEISFVAGQTFMLTVEGGAKRMMSIASPPSDKTHILLCHDTSPGGPASKWTRARKVGDSATFMAPFGMFTLDKTTSRKKVLVATGTGIAPFRSMVLDYLETGCPPASAYGAAVGGQGTDDITIYWGLRHEEDMYFCDEFQALSQKYPQFRCIVSLSKPPASWKGKVGHVTEHIVQEEPNLTGTDFYLCGNHNMVLDVEAQLSEKNVPKPQIHKELYF
jgi:NAD(P)H-flavin reductase